MPSRFELAIVRLDETVDIDETTIRLDLLETFAEDEEDVVDHVARVDQQSFVDTFTHEVILDGDVLTDELVEKSTETRSIEKAFDFFQLLDTLVGLRLVDQRKGRFTVRIQPSTNEAKIQFTTGVDQGHFGEEIIEFARIDLVDVRRHRRG